MFSIFKSDPSKKLRKDYEALLTKAMQAQRSGDIRSYSELSEQADAIYKKIEALEAKP